MYYLGNQTWECSSDINEIFTTPEPIRDDCIEGWIDDIGDMFDNENITSSNISDTIEKNLANATSGITGKGLIELSKDLDRLMNKRYDEIGLTYCWSQLSGRLCGGSLQYFFCGF